MKLPSRVSFLQRASSMQALSRRSTTRMQIQELLQFALQSPISRLPDELLALILKFLQDDLVQLDGYSRFDQWLHNSLVWRAWREVILNSATLWCYIQIFSYCQAKTMFERSRDAVINVMHQVDLRDHYIHPTPTDAMLSRLISNNLYRMRTLRLYGRLVDQFLSDAYPSSATHLLTTLTLDIRSMRQAWLDTGMLFSSVCRLQLLELCSVFIPPSASLFTVNLTVLSLDGGFVAASRAYTINEMIGVLKRTPFLCTLALWDWITDFKLNGGDPDDIAHLSELKTFQFSGRTLLQCVLFTERLVLPETSAIELQCSCETPSEAVSPLSSFPKHPGCISHPRYFKECTLCDVSGIFIHASPYIISPGQELRLLPGCLTLIINITHWTEHVDTDVVIQLLGLLDLHAVFLYLRLERRASVAWSPILSFFNTVSEIHLSACAWHHFVRDFSMTIPYETSNEVDATPRLRGVQDLCLLCPYLCMLQFHYPADALAPTVDPLYFESLALSWSCDGRVALRCKPGFRASGSRLRNSGISRC